MPYPCCMNLGYLPLRVVVRQSLFLTQVTSGLGYVFCFGQWNVTMVAEVKCSCMDWLATYLCLPTISHKKNVPREPRSRKKEKTCSRLELEVHAYTDPLQLRSPPWAPWAHEVHDVILWYFKVITQQNWHVKAIQILGSL